MVEFLNYKGEVEISHSLGSVLSDWLVDRKNSPLNKERL